MTTLDEEFAKLYATAVLRWPEDVAKENTESSSLSKLLDTQEKFLAILTAGSSSPSSWKSVLQESDMSPNLFLKHLMIISDYGGEPLKRLYGDFRTFFENEDSTHLSILFREETVKYNFKSLHNTKVSNNKLKVDGKGLAQVIEITPLIEDVCMLLLFANQSQNVISDEFEDCIVGTFIGKAEELREYAVSRYISVSSQMKGAKANSMGQILQVNIVKRLQKALGDSFKVKSNHLFEFSHNGISFREPFDIVVSNDDFCIGIELSFQVTTNSTIERKGSQARERMETMHNNSKQISYIVDGAGNFERKQAIMKILAYSDVTVAASDKGINELVSYIQRKAS